MLGPGVEPVTVPGPSGDVTAVLASLYEYGITLCNLIIMTFKFQRYH